MIALTVTTMSKRRFAITRPDRMDVVILKASNPEEAAQAAAEEWAIEPGGYTITTPTYNQENTP